jgi:host factor-I protein
MEKTAAQNIQDAFLNTARREKYNIVVSLLPGATLAGRIKSFDKFSIILDVGGQESLIFKHAIASIAIERRKSNLE